MTMTDSGNGTIEDMMTVNHNQLINNNGRSIIAFWSHLTERVQRYKNKTHKKQYSYTYSTNKTILPTNRGLFKTNTLSPQQ